MKYWRLYSSSEKEVGFVPQIVEPVFEGSYTDKNQIWNNYLKKIDNATIIPKGHLHKRAKPTDLMSVGFGSGDLFASDKLKTIIGAYKNVGVQFANSEIITKNGEYLKANIMHPFCTDHLFLDITKCEFRVSNVMGDIIYELLKFDSFDEFIVKKGAIIDQSKRHEDISFHKYISISKLAFKNNIDLGMCSVFDVTYGGFGFYVSQLVKDEILSEKCTGVIFREMNERYP